MATSSSPAMDESNMTPSSTMQFLHRCIQERLWEEAEAEMANAIRRWPDDERILFSWALLSNYRQRWADMAERFAVFRARFPTNVAGYVRGALAHRWLAQFREADDLIGAGLERAPTDIELLSESMAIAVAEKEWSAAEERAARLVAHFPDQPFAYFRAAESLRQQGKHAEADVRIAEGLHRLGPQPLLTLRFAEMAVLRGDWQGATRRWAGARRHFPADPKVHVGLAAAFTQLGQHDDAAGALLEGLAQLPGHRDIQYEYAWTLTRLERFDAAKEQWELLRARFPADVQIEAGWMHTAAQMQAEITSERETTGHFASASSEQLPPAEILTHFQSLGESCEFGLLQRRYKLEPISLFRWASTSIDPLIQALDTDFAGVGDPKNTRLLVAHGDEYVVKDIRLGFDMHSFVKVDQVDAEKFHIGQSKRLQFLTRRFREDAAAADQIMVRFTNLATDKAQIRRLFTALRRFGPVTLLHVMKAERPEQVGQVAWLEPGLMVGAIDRFGRTPQGGWDLSYNAWVKLCATALAMWSKARPEG